jgi:capsular polysaccharide transport system permease protein
MEPTQAQSAVYPERLTLQLVISLFLFLVWGIGVLIFYSVKDRR